MNKYSFKGMSIALGICDIFKPPHKILHQIDLIKPRAVILDYGCGPGNCTIAAAGGLAGRPDEKIGDNLYMVGDWVGKEGLLSNASFASAKCAAELILDV
jgi:hypothetical protein